MIGDPRLAATPVPADPPPEVEPAVPPCAAGSSPTHIAFVPVAAMEDVLALRARQIHEFGHTLAADLDRIARSGRRQAIAADAALALRDAIEDMHFNKDPGQIRRRLVKAAAMILAAIDAEDARRT